MLSRRWFPTSWQGHCWQEKGVFESASENQALKYLNNGRNGPPFKSSKWISAKSKTEKDSQREMERELWSVSTLTGVTFLFLLVWQKPIVSGFSHWLMDIVPIKVRKLDIYISHNSWKTFIFTGCQMCPFSYQDRINMHISLSVSELFTLYRPH